MMQIYTDLEHQAQTYKQDSPAKPFTTLLCRIRGHNWSKLSGFPPHRHAAFGARCLRCNLRNETLAEFLEKQRV